jgi:hypothetical protein
MIQQRKDEKTMKRLLCAILCLSLAAGIVSMDGTVQASKENTTNETAEKSAAAATETKSVEKPAVTETPAVETPVPQLPAYAGNITVNDETVFQVTVNSADKTCSITGYTGNKAVTTLYIPEKIGENTVALISDKTFASCPYLKNLIVTGDTEIQGSSTFYTGVKPEIWGKTGGKAATFATASGLVFHPLEGPGDVSAKKAAGLTKATLSWTAVNGAVSYKIYRKKGKEKYSLCKTVTTNTFVNDKLKAGATYKYKVKAVFSTTDGETIEGYSSNEVSVALVPAKLKKVTAKGVRGGIQVTWKRNKNVSGYQVYMKVHVKGFKTNFNLVKTIKTNKTTGYRCKMLVRGMKYSYKVRSFKKVNGKKIYGPYVTVTTRAK